MQLGFYFDQTRCTGCFACCVACKDWNDIPAGPANWIRVLCGEEGVFPEVFVSYLIALCYHCANPHCVLACPVGAITKRESDGIVVVDPEKCLGNRECRTLCLNACPWDIPQFGPEENARMQKCDLCMERWADKKKPICVEACPMRALDAGPLEELKTRYGESRNATLFTYSPKVKPSIIFKPKKH